MRSRIYLEAWQPAGKPACTYPPAYLEFIGPTKTARYLNPNNQENQNSND